MLKHPVIPRIKQYTDFTQVHSLKELRSHIVEIANQYGVDKDDKNTIKGDMFEIFVEYFINELGGSNFVPITDYEPQYNSPRFINI